MSEARHVLSLSGGKDSAALAIYMRDRVPNMEYIFHDTGKELPDTYKYLDRLEAFLGRPIVRTTAGVTFDQLLRVKGGMLPSHGRRWCTELMKLKPFETYIGDDFCYNYVGIRADEKRTGYISHKPNLNPIYPFRDENIDYAGMMRILTDSGIGLPPYTKWGRTRSGCFFCFYQQKIEWVRLKQTYPRLFEQAKAYEKPNRVNGNIFYWSEEPLTELEKPERMLQIEQNWKRAQERERSKRVAVPLVATLGGLELEPTMRTGCLMCDL